MIQRYPQTSLPYFEGHPDRLPKAPTAPTVNDEFDDVNLNSKWTLTSSGSVTHDINTTWPSHFYGTINLNAAANITLLQTYQPAADFSITAKIIVNMNKSVEYFYIDNYSADESDGIRIGIRVNTVSGTLLPAGYFHTRTSSTWSAATIVDPVCKQDTFYIHSQRIGTSNSGWISFNGMSFFRVGVATQVWTPDHFQLIWGSSATGNVYVRRTGIDWVRANWITLT